MSTSVRDVALKAGRLDETLGFYDQFLADEDLALASALPSGLGAVSPEIFARVSRHGYELADAVMTTHSPDLLQPSRRWTARFPMVRSTSVASSG